MKWYHALIISVLFHICTGIDKNLFFQLFDGLVSMWFMGISSLMFYSERKAS